MPAMPDIPDSHEADLIGLEHLSHPDGPDLVLFMAGNQFMAVPELLAAFQKRHPHIQRIFCETLPPGLELKQILAGGAVYRGRAITARPDAYAPVSRHAVDTLVAKSFLREADPTIYMHNRLAIMVKAGNPKSIRTVVDLGRDDVRVSQPDPELEHIGAHILDMYRAAGGEELVQRIMLDKLQAGTTRLTAIHHRETPARLLADEADCGPVWQTEVSHAMAKGLPLAGIEPGEKLDQRDRVHYWYCPMADAPHPEAAALFGEFLRSPTAREIFLCHGFIPTGTP